MAVKPATGVHIDAEAKQWVYKSKFLFFSFLQFEKKKLKKKNFVILFLRKIFFTFF
jgi:hypothetical protein